MSAKTGKPLRFGVDMTTGQRTWEIHEPAPGTELAVCSDCGFEFDASHLVTDEHVTPDLNRKTVVTRDPSEPSRFSARIPIQVAGMTGYECPRCVLQLFVAARQRVIEETVTKAAADLATTMRVSMLRLQAVALAGLQATTARKLEMGSARCDMAMDTLARALNAVGYPAEGRRAPARPQQVAGALAIIRASSLFRGDGALEESVQLVMEELERLLEVAT